MKRERKMYWKAAVLGGNMRYVIALPNKESCETVRILSEVKKKMETAIVSPSVGKIVVVKVLQTVDNFGKKGDVGVDGCGVVAGTKQKRILQLPTAKNGEISRNIYMHQQCQKGKYKTCRYLQNWKSSPTPPPSLPLLKKISCHANFGRRRRLAVQRWRGKPNTPRPSKWNVVTECGML